MEEYGYVSGNTPGFWSRFAPYIKSKTFTFVILAALAVATPLTAYYLQNNTFDTRQRAASDNEECYSTSPDSEDGYYCRKFSWSNGRWYWVTQSTANSQCAANRTGQAWCPGPERVCAYCWSDGTFHTSQESGGGGGGTGGGNSGGPQEWDTCSDNDGCGAQNNLYCRAFSANANSGNDGNYRWISEQTGRNACTSGNVGRKTYCGGQTFYCNGTTWQSTPILPTSDPCTPVTPRRRLSCTSDGLAGYYWCHGTDDSQPGVVPGCYDLNKEGCWSAQTGGVRNTCVVPTVTPVPSTPPQPSATPRPTSGGGTGGSGGGGTQPTAPAGVGPCSPGQCNNGTAYWVRNSVYYRDSSCSQSIGGLNALTTYCASAPNPTGTIGAANPTATPTGGVVGTNPTITSTPGFVGTTLALDLILQGIGLSTNLIDGEAQPNTNPALNARTKPVTLEITTAQSTTPITKTDTLTYDPSSKKFRANINIGNINNNFSVQIRMPGYATQLVGQRSGAVIQQPAASITIRETILAADINSDGFINGDDYEKAGSTASLKACFNKSPSTSNCQYADINADGKIDLIDYKFLIDNIIKRK